MMCFASQWAPFSAFSLRALSSSSSCLLAATVNQSDTKQFIVTTKTEVHLTYVAHLGGSDPTVTYGRRNHTLHTTDQHMGRWWFPLKQKQMIKAFFPNKAI